MSDKGAPMPLRAVLVILLIGCARAAGASSANGTVFRDDFEEAASRDAWALETCAAWEQAAGQGTVLGVCIPPAYSGELEAAARLRIDLAAYRGKRINLFCRAKAEDVTKPRDDWNGIKFMLHYRTPSTGERWESLPSAPTGSFAWRVLAFQLTLPEDIGEAELTLGLQDSRGRLLFDDVRIELERQQKAVLPAPRPNRLPAFTGHTQPRLRGAMVESEFNEEALRTLGQGWGANLVRWQITRDGSGTGANRDLPEYNRWLDQKLSELDHVLATCVRSGLLVAIDLHSLPGGRYKDDSLAMFYEQAYADAFVRAWEKMARRYKGRPGVWAYDLVNEPVQATPVPATRDNYWSLQVRAARAVRAIDPDTTILLEVDPWDSPEGFRFVQPVDIPRVVYQVHMYEPHAFTHQRVDDPKGPEIRYPGVIDGQAVDKEALRRALQPVRDFQLAHNVAIYVGEFSAIRWAPGACDYLRDCIELFEEYGWDWSYHAFREWDGWSVEHGADRNDHTPTAEPVDRQRLLRGWLEKNRFP